MDAELCLFFNKFFEGYEYWGKLPALFAIIHEESSLTPILIIKSRV